ncbi:MAG: FKBP-type peptidyl-prolyl cis-trans isomerase [Rhodothermales bacterium]
MMKQLAGPGPLFLLLCLTTLLVSCDTTENADPIVIGPPRVVPDSAYTVTDTGLKIFDFVVGTGPIAEPGDNLLVHYNGWLTDGTLFDSSRLNGQPFGFIIGAGQVIPGWDEGLLNMRVGGERQLVIPPHLAYGIRGRGSIPPNATLIFEVELLGIQ